MKKNKSYICTAISLNYYKHQSTHYHYWSAQDKVTLFIKCVFFPPNFSKKDHLHNEVKFFRKSEIKTQLYFTNKKNVNVVHVIMANYVFVFFADALDNVLYSF